MSTDQSEETEICGASNRNDEPCKLAAGWGTPDSTGRCKFHGGASTGPKDTSHLEGNDHAVGNPGGGAPEGNTNARVHGAWGDWEIAYDRFEGETKEYVDRLVESIQERAAEHAPDVDKERREQLAKEDATLRVLKRRAEKDVWGFITDSDTGRGVLVEEEREDSERNVERLNPATKAVRRIEKRQRSIAKKLGLRSQFQEDGEA